MPYTHIDNDSDDDWWYPLCGVTWTVEGEDDSYGPYQDLQEDRCEFLKKYVQGAGYAPPGTTWCPGCLNHPDLPIHELRYTNLGEEYNEDSY